MRLIIAVAIGKLIAYLCRLLKIGGGTAAPGLYALKIDPNLVDNLSTRLPKNVIITGTNGKTTTARMLAHFAKERDLKVIRNHTGSNLERGIASTLLHLPSSTIHLPDLGIWELDEAAFNLVAPKIKPDIVVFLNVFRDQLDRYGEVDSVVKKWCQTLNEMDPETVVLINGDDTNTAKLENCFKGKVFTFGVKDYKIIGESLEHKVYPHKLNFEAKNVTLNGLKSSSFLLSFRHLSYTIHLPVPGIYHIYDAVAAIACAVHLFPDTPIHRYTDTLKSFSPAFGRVEKLPFGFIFLIKNPAGATQVFETLAPNLKPNDRLLLALNDNLADGTDVSWIWDAQFELLNVKNSLGVNVVHPPGVRHIIAFGSRAQDLAVRLKYAGFDPDLIHVEPDLKKALREARNGLKGRLFILPTYTAMLEIQRVLVKMRIKSHYWEDS